MASRIGPTAPFTSNGPVFVDGVEFDDREVAAIYCSIVKMVRFVKSIFSGNGGAYQQPVVIVGGVPRAPIAARPIGSVNSPGAG
jgi:hypothetical protein